MKYLIYAALLACALPMTACSKEFDNSTVKEFDLFRFLGRWYETARYNHSFEKGMDNTMADYILQDDGTVFVLNTGWKKGKFKVAEGKARYNELESAPGAMKVSFFWFFYSEYNVLMLDDDYQMALIGSRSDNYLWILSRTPEPDPDLLQTFIEDAERRGYDISRLIWVDQSRNIAEWQAEQSI